MHEGEKKTKDKPYGEKRRVSCHVNCQSCCGSSIPPLVFIPNAMLNNPTEKYVEIPVWYTCGMFI